MKQTTPIQVINEGLSRIKLVPLARPPVKPTEEPTEALVNWGIRCYVYSLIAHVRTILKALILISAAENVSAEFILCRHIFEWTAHACYMGEKLSASCRKKLWREAWNLLSVATMGNLWIKRYGAKYGALETTFPDFDDVPSPIRIGDAVASYGEYLQRNHREPGAKDSYGFLSEHSHPNSACLQPYQTFTGNFVYFRDTKPRPSPLHATDACLIDLIIFLNVLLSIGADRKMQPHVFALMQEVAKLGRQQVS